MFYTERTILRDLLLDIDLDLKIILLDHQNNFVKTLKIMSNAAKKFDILTTDLTVFT